VLVTGGASGLGAATADAVAAAGGTPVVLDRGRVAAHDSVAVDLADTAAAHDAVERALRRHGGLDAVVTCAGIDVPGPLTEVPRDEWERVVAVNLLGTVAVVRAALASLLERHGRVVTVASTLGHRAVGDATAYCASKFGVVGFTRALTAELKGRVGVTMLTPGGMQTAFFDGRPEVYKPAPDARLCPPGEVAAAIVFALARPAGCEVKEIVVAPPDETSWP
jgi:NAD(P)-dependent dehydrogenase (short-subunit alcohol dehydrogenase family)